MADITAVLVGCGGMANAWMNVIEKTPGLKIVGLVDVRRPAAEAMAEKYKLPATVVYDDLPQALERVKPKVVFDVTVPGAHCGVTVTALKAGCHVLGEKPLADSMASAKKMIAAAAKAKRLYAVIQNRRYDPNIQRVQKTLKSGAIGPINEIHADFFMGPHFGGFRDAMDFPLVLDMAIHTFDQARFMTGADPVAAYCHSYNPKGSWYKGDAAAIIIFEMTGGIVFGYRGSWCAEGIRTSWQSEWRVIGRKGSLEWDGETGVKAEAVKAKPKPGFFLETEPVTIPEVKVEHPGHAGLIREFVQCVRTGRKPQTICTDNVKSLAMVLAAVESAKTGKRVKVAW